MKWHKTWILVGALCLSFLSYSTQNQAQAKAKVASSNDAKITVLSPMGMPPSYQLKPMAQRPSSLDGKTVYIVDDGFVGGENLLKEMVAWFNKNMPKVNVVYKRKAGSFQSDDPPLFAEIKEKGDAMIMGMGH
jgi:hypothetical protein